MEYWDIYDRDGNLTGKVVEKGTKMLPGEYHKAVEIWIVNDKRQFLIQKRSDEVEYYPGYWGLTTGRLQHGEKPIEGAVREVGEELGLVISDDELSYLIHLIRDDALMIWDIFMLRWNGSPDELTFRDHEVDTARWVTEDELYTLMREGKIFTYPEMKGVIEKCLSLIRD